ncbi:MAG: biotin carboxylase N-terminal domain-containing protein [Reyranella sp.]|nr:biotin carboxylase N-terminal domain-containing protein [Reyranella sp.]MDP3159606.1 biotin carboxylase N-terminal domain-containing protein [Reyranella sp.]
MNRLPQSLLIANRGEIAVRIARTCRSLGIRSVAVHSVADADALHVHLCDAAVELSGPALSSGYLDGAQIIRAAISVGAEAVHPGYGFLAENAAFAADCKAAGLIFVGPSAEAIAQMGDKIASKRLAEKAGVPVVPGVEEQSDAADRDTALIEAARGLTFPLLVKASAGGGGKGMRIAEAPDALAAAIALARREAKAAFGDDRMLIERFVANPRHVEVQVFGDKHGNMVHLHERDCSIQRRHQKLIEEAPAPGLSDKTRAALHEAALRLARQIGYDNAGTVEFVLDAATHEFFFLEMNTRLQVEHAVTEAILGVDLVEWQIRVACGQVLPAAQGDLSPVGWAIEARLNAEDPAADFRPQTGRVAHVTVPHGPGVRFETGIAAGQMISPFYDPTLAKVIAHGSDRATAISRLRNALSVTSVLGLKTNGSFLHRILGHEAFASGEATTQFLTRHFPDGWASKPDPLDIVAAIAAACAGAEAAPSASPWTTLTSWRLGAGAGLAARMSIVLLDEAGERHASWVRMGDGRLAVSAVGDDEVDPSVFGYVFRDGALTLMQEGRATRYFSRVEGDEIHLDGGGSVRLFRKLAGLGAWKSKAAAAEGGGGGVVRAPGPGRIVSVEVAVGDQVKVGAPLVVIESMKMFQTITARVRGQVTAVGCAANQAVSGGDLLIEIASDETSKEET